MRGCAGSGARPDKSSWRWWRLFGCGAGVTELLAWRPSVELQPGLRVPPGLRTPDVARALSPPGLDNGEVFPGPERAPEFLGPSVRCLLAAVPESL